MAEQKQSYNIEDDDFMAIEVGLQETSFGAALDHDLDTTVLFMVLPKIAGWRASAEHSWISMSHQTYLDDLNDVIEAEIGARRKPREVALLEVDTGRWQTVASWKKHDSMFPEPTTRDDGD